MHRSVKPTHRGFKSRPVYMEIEHMRTPFNEFKSVEATKAASVLVQKLFPDLPLPIQGELQTMTRLTWERGGQEPEVLHAGHWWLWFRNIFIENTMTRDTKRKIQIFACAAATRKQPLTIVTTRSPELAHAQIGMADASLPRSRSALEKLKSLVDASAHHIPTSGKVLLADLAVDNAQEIAKVCDIDTIMKDNLVAIRKIADEVGLTSTFGTLSELIPSDDTPPIPPKSWGLIRTAMAESLESHLNRFGWTKEQSEDHNLMLATTMGKVGAALHEQPGHVLLHNEAFISRGALNNIFNPPHDPLPVICLRDLLESKRTRG